MEFEWDENKNKINITKHGIDFSDVVEIFEHPMLVLADRRHDYGEDRWIGIGLLKMIVAVVVFTEMGAERVRIISARKATKYERKKYSKKIKNELEKTQIIERQRY